jgi:uncharacterized protein (DUF2141 family)
MALKLRLRALAGFLAGMAVVFALAWADTAFAAHSVRITSPAQGDTVAGDVRVEGIVGGTGAVQLSLALAPQVLGDCRPAALERIVTVDAGEPFAVTLLTSGLAPGTYCVVAVADEGRLSAAVGNVAVEPGLTQLDGFQLPTLPLDAAAPVAAAPTALDAAIAVPIALGSIAAVGVVVLSLSLLYRRREVAAS